MDVPGAGPTWQAGAVSTPREQPWSDDPTTTGRIVVLTRNPIAEAIETIAAATGRQVVVVEPDDEGRGAEEISSLSLRRGDAVVLCDHDAPDAPRVLRESLACPASYVAMMASRSRAQGLLEELGAEGAVGVDKLHVPAGLNTGGRAPGEIALSVVAEIVAESYGRNGGSLRGA